PVVQPVWVRYDAPVAVRVADDLLLVPEHPRSAAGGCFRCGRGGVHDRDESGTVDAARQVAGVQAADAAGADDTETEFLFRHCRGRTFPAGTAALPGRPSPRRTGRDPVPLR